jgi:calpain-15
VDQTFPANNRSLTGEWGYIKKWKDVKWQKISDIIKNPVIFDHKVEPSDIKQGQLGDCYFLAALSALADRPERIFNLFLVLEENTQKYYACKIMYKGKWKTIDLDEYIPTLNGKPAFSKATGQ